MSFLVSIIGACALIFRLWLVEGKLRSDLDINRAHISRILSYYFCLAMFLEFQSNAFTMLIVVAMPGMLMAIFVFDVPYYANFNKIEARSQNKGWLLIERFTLHIPLFLYGVFFYATGKKSILRALYTVPNIIIGLLLTMIPFFLMDPRWTKKQDTPRGKWIIFGMVQIHLKCLSLIND